MMSLSESYRKWPNSTGKFVWGLGMVYRVVSGKYLSIANFRTHVYWM